MTDNENFVKRIVDELLGPADGESTQLYYRTMRKKLSMFLELCADHVSLEEIVYNEKHCVQYDVKSASKVRLNATSLEMLGAGRPIIISLNDGFSYAVATSSSFCNPGRVIGVIRFRPRLGDGHCEIVRLQIG